MHHFAYRDGVLHAEDVPLPMIAGEVGTPFYCYSTATLQRHYRVFARGLRRAWTHLVCYAMKANSNQAVMRTLARLRRRHGRGLGRRAAGGRWPPACPAGEIVFSGVGKTAREMALALEDGIHCFNVESEPELELLSEIADRARARARRSSLRINPDVDAKTHAKISTGKAENKFGIPFSGARARLRAGAARCPASRSPASTCISAARSPSLAPFDDAFG